MLTRNATLEDVFVKLVESKAIARSEGKAVRVVDNRKI